MKDYEVKISQFIDNELPVNEQQELFRFLSENGEAREVLADFVEIKNETKMFYAEMNVESDDSKIIGAVFNKGDDKKKYKTLFYFSAAASVVFAFLFLSSFLNGKLKSGQYEKLQTKYISLQKGYVNVLNEKAELEKLNDNLSVEIQKANIKQAAVRHKPVTQMRSAKAKDQKSNLPAKHTFRNRNVYAANTPVYKITKDDFLGQQIIGN